MTLLGVLIDFSRAFDSVSHTILLDKLSMYGCPQVVISWLANFLTDRTQSVASFSGISNKLAITRSIIQGSGIGPTAFIAMIADLQPSHKTTKLCKYADDLTVVIPGSLSFHGNDEIENIKLWAIQNKLFINTAKSKEIVLRRPRSLRNANQPAVLCNIEQVNEVKLLGVWFNHHLSFSVHVDRILAVVNQRFYLLNRLRRQGLDPFGLSVVFNALIISKLLYACQAFSGFLSASDLCRLQTSLNKAYRYELTTVKYDIKMLFEERDFHLFKQIQQHPGHCLHELLPSERDNHGRFLRSRGHQYALPLVTTSFHKSSFVNRCLFEFI